LSQPSQVDLFDPAFKANPYPTYARLRSDDPIHRVTLPDGHDMWLVTRYEDVSAVLKDERFVKEAQRIDPGAACPDAAGTGGDAAPQQKHA
jgi:cytochrome P450